MQPTDSSIALIMRVVAYYISSHPKVNFLYFRVTEHPIVQHSCRHFFFRRKERPVISNDRRRGFARILGNLLDIPHSIITRPPADCRGYPAFPVIIAALLSAARAFLSAQQKTNPI